MSWLLTAISGLIFGKQLIDERKKSVIPSVNWRNTDLIFEDRITKRVPFKQYMDNLRNGRYYLPDVPPNAIINDMDRYNKDSKYNFMRAYKAALNGDYSTKPIEPNKDYKCKTKECEQWLKLLG